MCCPPGASVAHILLNICREKKFWGDNGQHGQRRWKHKVNICIEQEERSIISFCPQDNLLAAFLNILLMHIHLTRVQIRLLQPLMLIFKVGVFISFCRWMCGVIPKWYGWSKVEGAHLYIYCFHKSALTVIGTAQKGSTINRRRICRILRGISTIVTTDWIITLILCSKLIKPTGITKFFQPILQ